MPSSYCGILNMLICVILSMLNDHELGEFGVVYKGMLTRNSQQELVAVKTLKGELTSDIHNIFPSKFCPTGIFATANDIQSFTEEILILQQFNHPNVMSLIGVCLGADKVGGGPSIILPFMSKGSLLNFLRKEADRLRPSKDADITQVYTLQHINCTMREYFHMCRLELWRRVWFRFVCR